MKSVKPKLEVAGAGSGKTTRMVDRIVGCIPNLEPHRFLVAITYTNAATNSIKEKLSQKTKIPPNVFVGTTYAFFNKFLVLPYSTIVPKITVDKKKNLTTESYIALDKLFFELNENKLKKILKANNPNWTKKTPQEKQMAENVFIRNLIKKGKIPFDKIVSIASYLIQDNKVIRDIVGQRIQYLFVDEFQDANNQQFVVFDEIRKAKKTVIYKVGDAEQFIHNFRANLKEFNKIPIIQHKDKYEVETVNINNRCSNQITTFINKFNTQLQQEAKFSTVEKKGVFFIDNTDLTTIANIFRTNTTVWETEPNFKRFYLAFENDQYNSISNSFGLIKISNDSKKAHNILSEVLQIIFKMEGCSQKELCEKYSINTIQLRTLAVKLWKKTFSSIDEFKLYFTNELKLSIVDDYVDVDEQYKYLDELKRKSSDQKHSEFTTSIHKSKGLEATCVLVVAKSNDELSKWLETDFLKRNEIQHKKDGKIKQFDDTCRLGFVAFSRAKTALHIACLENLVESNKEKLRQLNII